MKQVTTFEHEEWLCILAGLRAAKKHLEDALWANNSHADSKKDVGYSVGKAYKELSDLLEEVLS